jgi:hypothetical protein
MEEATELFSIQQGMIRAASRSSASAQAAAASAGAPGAAPPASGSIAGLSPMSDEGLALALLAFGTGAGVLAAILKRNRDGPAPERPRAP